MDNKLVIVGRRHGSQIEEILSGPELSIPAQQEKFIQFRVKETDPEFEHVALCRLMIERSHRLGQSTSSSSQGDGAQSTGAKSKSKK